MECTHLVAYIRLERAIFVVSHLPTFEFVFRNMVTGYTQKSVVYGFAKLFSECFSNHEATMAQIAKDVKVSCLEIIIKM